MYLTIAHIFEMHCFYSSKFLQYNFVFKIYFFHWLFRPLNLPQAVSFLETKDEKWRAREVC